MPRLACRRAAQAHTFSAVYQVGQLDPRGQDDRGLDGSATRFRKLRRMAGAHKDHTGPGLCRHPASAVSCDCLGYSRRCVSPVAGVGSRHSDGRLP